MGPTTVHRPILRHDVAFLEAQDGLVVRVDGVNFFVRGRTAYRYLSALVPHLDGDTTLAELVAGLPESQGDTVRSLIEALHSKGAVIDAHEPPEDIDESLLDQFADQRLLLLHHGDDGRGLARILAARVLVHGRDEQPMTQLMSALSDNGIGHGPDGLLAVTQGVTEDTLAGVDVLIHVCTQRHSGELLELARFCTAAGCAFLPIVRLGDQLMLGPWQGPGQSGGVASLLIRLRENAIDGADEILAAAAVGDPASRRPDLLAPAAPEIAVALAGFEVFKTLAGVIPSQLHDRVLFLDSLTLSTRSEFLVPHPCVSDYRADPPTSAPRSDDQIEADYTRYQGLVSAHCGLMAEFSDDKAPQIPLRVGVLSAPACAPEAIVEFGTDTVLGCRLRALERAAAHYALALHTRVDLLPAAGADARSVGRAQPGERSLRVAATDAFTGEQLALSKDECLASQHSCAASLYAADTRGAQAAPTPAQAQRRAVLDAIGHWAIDRVEDGRSAVRRVRQEQARAADPALRSLLNAAAAEGLRLDLYAEVAGQPVALVHRPGEPNAVAASGGDWVSAATKALVLVLGTHQVRGTPWAAAARPRWIALDDMRLAADMPDDVRLDRAPTTAELGSLLARHGLSVAVIDLSTPDLATACAVSRAVLYDTDRFADSCPVEGEGS